MKYENTSTIVFVVNILKKNQRLIILKYSLLPQHNRTAMKKILQITTHNW